MAVIGDRLATPESGWKRYDTVSGREISYTGGTWTSFASNAEHLGITPTYSTSASGIIKFAFVGTKIRLMHRTYPDQRTTVISIDGVSEQYATKDINSNGYGILCYEKTGLDHRKHFVEISYLPDNSISGAPDAIDIDDAGSLFHYDEVTNIKDLDVGKRIRCNYSATSGAVGVFSGLGQETANFIPVTGTATPNGDFYFIMVEGINRKKILIADRNIQYTISWDTLNKAGLASRSGLRLQFTPSSTAYEYAIRLLSGGVESTDKDNDWDKYIVNSTLNGVIVSGDNAVWNWRGNSFAWTSTTLNGNSAYRIVRGNTAVATYTSSDPSLSNGGGFRPVLEIKELQQLKSLILSNGEYKRWNEVNGTWESVSTTQPDEVTFKNDGMSNLSVFDRRSTVINVSMDDNTSSGEALGVGRMFRERIDLRRYVDIRMINVK